MTVARFTQNANSVVRLTGGTPHGTVATQAFADPDNDECGEEFPIPLLTLGPGSFEQTVSASAQGLGVDRPYSLAARVTIAHEGSGPNLSSPNNDSHVPESHTLALMGLGLAVFGYRRRRRKED